MPETYRAMMQRLAEEKAAQGDAAAERKARINNEAALAKVLSSFLPGGQDGAPGKDGKDGKDGAPGRDGVTTHLHTTVTETVTRVIDHSELEYEPLNGGMRRISGMLTHYTDGSSAHYVVERDESGRPAAIALVASEA